jgi:hypothetical protein
MTMIRRLTVWVACMTVALVTMALALAGAAHAQGSAAPDAAGQWHGTLSTPVGDLHVGVTLARDASGKLTGTLLSADQDNAVIPIGTATAADGKLSLDIPAVGGGYEGKWDAGQQAWDGLWTQGQSFKLVLLKGPVAAKP